MGDRMRTRLKAEIEQPDLAVTPAVSTATQLICGTALPVAGSGLNLTSPSPSQWRGFARFATSPMVLKVSLGRPRVSPRRSRAAKQEPTTSAGVYKVMAAIAKTGAPPVSDNKFVVFQQIRRIEPRRQAKPVKMIGKEGSDLRPIKKSYDLDLDEYQS